MRKFILAGTVAGVALVLASAAQAGHFSVVGNSDPTDIPDNNDFKAQLAALGLTQVYSLGATVNVVLGGSPKAIVTYYSVAAESGFTNTFTDPTAPGVTFTELGFFDAFPAGNLIVGSAEYFADGPLGAVFTTDFGVDAPNGTAGFGVFAPVGANPTELYLGYDDDGGGQDDNHDDLIIRAVITNVPVPAAIPLFLSGLAGIGLISRRRARA